MTKINYMLNMQDEQSPEQYAISNMRLGMAYVPMQRWEKLYDPDIALSRGTLFQALDLPFIGEEAVPRG